jgi:uncharacterized membrane protein
MSNTQKNLKNVLGRNYKAVFGLAVSLACQTSGLYAIQMKNQFILQINNTIMGFEVLMGMFMNITNFWILMPYSLVE